MIAARIYQPAKTAVQQGRAKTKHWVLEMEPTDKQLPDPLMGWMGSSDTQRQLYLRFPTKEAAIAYCERNGMTYTVFEPQQRVMRPKSYAENFIRKT